MSAIQGGSFGHGFASAAVTQAATGRIDNIGGNGGARVAAAALVGGSVSALTGGKFANGALTAAFSRAVNDEAHSVDDFGQTRPTGDFVMFRDGFGRRMWIHRSMVAQAVVQNAGPPTDFEAVLSGEVEGQASFRAGAGVGVRIDIASTATSRSFFIGVGAVDGLQAVVSVGVKEGANSGLTMKSNASVGVGRSIQINASMSEAGGGAKVQGQFNVGSGYGLGGSMSPLVFGYTWSWEKGR